MKMLGIIFALLAGGYGVWIVTNNNPQIKTKVAEILDMGHFHTLEIRYNASQIMEKHRRALLKDNRHRFLEPLLEFYPYTLMEVKYTTPDNKTHESVILWDMTDGEMVMGTKNWEKTHGFGDCIEADASSQEFKVLNLLARKGGALDREGLTRALNVEHEILDGWIDSCRKKKLIIQAGNQYHLHFQDPRLRASPETIVDERLVTKPYKDASRLHPRFSISQIKKIAEVAFGQNFATRKTTVIYLPVHSIIVQNPDGSIHTSHWNALNGQRMTRSQFID
jgi:hypothetical protein